MDKMTIFEAELVYDGWRRKSYDSWLQTQRICYILALANSGKQKPTPNKVLDLSSFDDLFEEHEIENNTLEEETNKETAEELRQRLAGQIEERLKMINGQSN